MSSLKKILESIKNIYSKITSLTTRVTNLENKTVETEWTTCTMNSGFTNGALSSSKNLMYIKIGNMVFIKGSCKGFKSGNTVCTQLPERIQTEQQNRFYSRYFK